MKNRLNNACLLCISCVLLVACLESPETKSETRSQTTPHSFDLSALRPGDIVVKKGRGMLSQRIADHLKEKIPLSHCGIISGKKDSLYVIHSVAKELTGIDGVQRVDMQTFMKDVVRGTFYAVRLTDTTVATALVEAAAQRYAANQVPFDYQLDHSDSSKMNCSELIFWALKSATGKDHFQRIPIGSGTALAFNSLLDTSHFSIITRQ